MNIQKYRVRRIVRFAILAIVLIPLFGFVVMSLWNWLMPELFGLPRIGFWQAWGLFVLSKIVFGSFRGQPFRHHQYGRLRERWGHLSDEDREAFRRGVWQRPSRNHRHDGEPTTDRTE